MYVSLHCECSRRNAYNFWTDFINRIQKRKRKRMKMGHLPVQNLQKRMKMTAMMMMMTHLVQFFSFDY
jgi:hypothetical protein